MGRAVKQGSWRCGWIDYSNGGLFAKDSMKMKYQFSIRQYRKYVFVAFVLISAMVQIGVTFGGDGRDAEVPLEVIDLVGVGRLDKSIPTPESVIGHAVGADAVRYDALIRYLEALADSSDLVTLERHGKTHEGRDLVHFVITSRRNHGRIDEIKRDAGKLADPRKFKSEPEAAGVVDDLPGIAWLAYSIHGDEVSPCDSAMMLAYLLVAGSDAKMKRLREELVIVIDPLQNPDGRERYLSQIQSMRGKVENPDIQAMHHAGLWSAGRGNHYLFDMNRDWILQTQPETRGRAKAILEWHPQLLVDGHEMEGTDTYLFDPPREPLNAHTAESVMKWRRKMSKDQARAFNKHGWSYYTKEWYEEWYPGYTNSWASLLGAAGLLYEQAGVNGASVKQEAGGVLTYREAVAHNVVSSLANLETLRVNRKAILKDYLADRRKAVSEDGGEGTERGGGGGVFVVRLDGDRSRLARFVDLLGQQGIAYSITAGAKVADDARNYWGEREAALELPAGSVVVPVVQPERRLLEAILDFDPHMTDEFLAEERTELELGRGTKMYDVSAWNPAMAYGLDAWRASDVRDAPGRDEVKDDEKRVNRAARAGEVEAPFGYVIDAADSDVFTVLARLFRAGCEVRAAKKPFMVADVSYDRGALLLRGNENADDLKVILEKATAGTHVRAVSVETALSDDGPDLGGGEFELLYEPRVAIASQWPVSTTSFGSVWYLLDDRYGVRASPINIQSLGRMDLRKYNVLILPSSFGLQRVLGNGGTEHLRTWVEAGGTLIAIGGSASALASGESEMTSVRLRSDVLDELDVYAEAVEREMAAHHVTVDSEEVWRGPGDEGVEDSDVGERGADEERGANEGGDGGKKVVEKGEEEEETDEDEILDRLRGGEGDVEALERADRWARRFSPQGAIVAGCLNPEQWLAFGIGDRLPILLSGGSIFMSKAPVETAVRLADENELRLSGLLWPEARVRAARSAYATVEGLGNGQVILFAGDPFFRGGWEGSGRLLMNAVMLGPGMGTSQPLPW